MTEGLQQEVINFDKGIVRTPSAGAAGELSECVNLISRHGELVNIQPPVPIGIELAHTLCYIHTTPQYINYIQRDGKSLYYSSWDKDANGGKGAFFKENGHIADFEVDTFKIISCGNVLAVYGGDLETQYYLWRNREYTYVDSVSLGDLPIRFGLDPSFNHSITSGDMGIQDSDNVVIGEFDYDLIGTYEQSFYIDGRDIDSVDLELDEVKATIKRTLRKGQIIRVVVDGPELSYTSFKMADHQRKMTDTWEYVWENGARPREYWKNYENEVATGTHDWIVEEDHRVYQLEFGVYNGMNSKDRIGTTYRLRLFIGTPRENETHTFNKKLTNVNGVFGARNKYLEDARKRGVIVGDRFVRYGFRSVTGDMLYTSAPILLSMSDNSIPTLWYSNRTDGENTEFHVAGYESYLYYHIENAELLRSLVDVNPSIATLVIALSRPIDKVNTDAMDAYAELCTDTQIRTNAKGIYGEVNDRHDVRTEHLSSSNETQYNYDLYSVYLPHKSRNMTEIIEDASVFHVVAEISKDKLRTDEWIKVRLDSEELVKMEGDTDSYNLLGDTASKAYRYSAKEAFVYNNRLSFSNVNLTQILSSPYDFSYGYIKSSPMDINEMISVDIDGEERFLCYGKAHTDALVGKWFFVPMPKAKEVVLYRHTQYGGYEKALLRLTAHPFLNGAYHYGYPVWEDDPEHGVDKPASTYTSREENKYITSALNQPLVPDAITGYIGSGEILGVSTATKALSQGQFGQFPLQFFCSDGIWAVGIGSDGSYQTTNPVARDVLTNPAALTQTDGAIIFPTAHGLKVLQGSDTALLSANVHGLNINEGAFLAIPDYTSDTAQFLTQIDDAGIVYDYVNQLLHVFFGGDVHYVYSMESGQWSKQWLQGFGELKAIVPGYPYSTLQFGDKLYQYRNDVSQTPRDGFLLTRPFTLGSPLVMKTLWDLRCMGQKTSAVSRRRVRVFYSQDGVRWYQLRSFKAGSAKYFRLFVTTRFTDIDTLAGAVIQYREKWQNKLR